MKAEGVLANAASFLAGVGLTIAGLVLLARHGQRQDEKRWREQGNA
jgi:hypothetical protein